MALSYKRLWKLLIDRDMKKKDLMRVAGISTVTVAKMAKGGGVSASTLDKICIALNCDLPDVVEVVRGKSMKHAKPTRKRKAK